MGQGTLKFSEGGKEGALMEVSFLLPGFDVTGSFSCFDGVVCCADFNIHAADRERRAEGRGDFWSNRKLICG